MSVTIQKTKPKAKTATAPKVEQAAEQTLEEFVDEYGAVKEEVLALAKNPIFAKLKLLEEKLKGILKEYEPLSEVTVQGKVYLLEAGVCRKAPRKLESLDKARKFLGEPAFMKLASISIGDLEKYLTPPQLEKVLSKEEAYTDNRTVKIQKIAD